MRPQYPSGKPACPEPAPRGEGWASRSKTGEGPRDEAPPLFWRPSPALLPTDYSSLSAHRIRAQLDLRTGVFETLETEYLNKHVADTDDLVDLRAVQVRVDSRDRHMLGVKAVRILRGLDGSHDIVDVHRILGRRPGEAVEESDGVDLQSHDTSSGHATPRIEAARRRCRPTGRPRSRPHSTPACRRRRGRFHPRSKE